MSNRRFWSVVPGDTAALLPSISCPACRPAYASIFSSLGLGAIVDSPYYSVLLIGLLGVTLFGLGYGARARRGYLPLLVGTAATFVTVANKWLAGPPVLDFVSAGLLVSASVWNSWPKRNSNSANSGNTNTCDCSSPTI